MSDTETLRQLFAKRSSGLRISAASSTAHRAIPRHFLTKVLPFVECPNFDVPCLRLLSWIMCMIGCDSWER